MQPFCLGELLEQCIETFTVDHLQHGDGISRLGSVWIALGSHDTLGAHQVKHLLRPPLLHSQSGISMRAGGRSCARRT